MREIKFRAWDKKNKTMLYWENEHQGQANGDDLYYMSNWDLIKLGIEGIKEDNLILLQYTGLNDKNGVEIYEGDIVKYQYNKDVDCVLEVRFGRHEVGFDSDCAVSAIGQGFHFKWIRGGRDILGIPYMEHLGKDWCEHYLGEQVNWGCVFEIIGNIYENPELKGAK